MFCQLINNLLLQHTTQNSGNVEINLWLCWNWKQTVLFNRETQKEKMWIFKDFCFCLWLRASAGFHIKESSVNQSSCTISTHTDRCVSIIDPIRGAPALLHTPLSTSWTCSRAVLQPSPWYVEHLVLGGHTNGKQFNPSILQALRWGYDIILGLPIGDEDSYLGNTGSGAWLWFEAVLQDEGQSQTCSDWKKTPR